MAVTFPRAEADPVASPALASEAKAREDGDAKEAEARAASDAAEAKAREAADKAEAIKREEAVADEASDREAADSKEVAAREAADANLQGEIEAGDSAEATAREEADDAERSAREAADALLQPLSEKGKANGYTPLDGAGKVPVAHLPSSLMEYKGTWDAKTNSPELKDGTGDVGDVYRVSVAGERDLGSGPVKWTLSSYAIYNGATWEKSGAADGVQTVNGKSGDVTLTAADVGADAAGAAASAEATAKADTKAEKEAREEADSKEKAAREEADKAEKKRAEEAESAIKSTAANEVKSEKERAETAESGKVPATRKVAGKELTADITLVKGDVGLGNVDNTSDAEKNKAVATLEGKRITPRVQEAADATTITAQSDEADLVIQTNTKAKGTLTIAKPAGTPTGGQELTIRVKSTNAHTLSFNAIFRGSLDTPTPTALSGGSLTDYFKFLYNAVDAKWDLVGVSMGY